MPAVSSLIEFVGIRVSNDAASMITMAVFVSLIAIGARTENEFKGPNREIWAIKWSNIFNINIIIGIIFYLSQIALFKLLFISPYITKIYTNFPLCFVLFSYFLYLSSIVVGLRGWPLWASLTVAISMIGFSFIFGYNDHAATTPDISETTSAIVATFFAVACGLTVVAIAPPLAFTRRIIFMVVGVLFIVLLGKINNYGITASPYS